MESDIKILQPAGLLDSIQGKQLHREVSENVRKGLRRFLIDFQDVTLMDSSGLGALVVAFQEVRSVDGQFAFCSVGPKVRMVFELTGLDQTFEFYTDQTDFKSAATQASTVSPSS
ncbi:MAG: STAS domain-containing protein [Leptolyngbyaceae cyanobacterium bins.59]|nr:STAS domain-containing protein [Leptolyngbyaceae cyanobacterium bins.59]